MKKTYRRIGMVLLVILCYGISACSDDDNEDSSALVASYHKIKTGIVGTWLYNAKYHSRTTNPYMKSGWDDNDEYGLNKLSPMYILSFRNDGTFSDKEGEVFTYSLELDEKYTPFFTQKDYEQYWPYSKGVIRLLFDNSFYRKAYLKEVFAEIRDDGMLYFYDADLGKSGAPIYRFRKQ